MHTHEKKEKKRKKKKIYLWILKVSKGKKGIKLAYFTLNEKLNQITN